MNYRFDEGQRTIAFGNFPGVSFAKAREKRALLGRHRLTGLTPHKLARRGTGGQGEIRGTFKAIGEEFYRRWDIQGHAAETPIKASNGPFALATMKPDSLSPSQACQLDRGHYFPMSFTARNTGVRPDAFATPGSSFSS
jgi:hypothetical protein